MRSGGTFDIETKKNRAADLDKQAAMPGFWDDNVRAQRVMKEKGGLDRQIRDAQNLRSLVEDIETLVELGTEMEDADTIAEAASSLETLEAATEKLEIQRLLSAEEDAMDAIIEINSGAGGTDAADWAGMLLEMYSRWAEKNGYGVELLEKSEAEEAGIRSASLAIRGPYAF